MKRGNHYFNAALGMIVTLVVAGCTAPRFSPVATGPPDKALIYIYRKSHLGGIAGNHRIFVNGQAVTSLYNGSYYPYFAVPGTNRFSSRIVSPSAIMDATMNASFQGDRAQLNAEAGKTYYIQFKIGTTWGPKMAPVDAETGAKDIVKCRLAKALK